MIKGLWGAHTDRETGLVLMGWRYYDPQTGRFLTRDPIGTAGGANLYAYTSNNPVNYVDPLGLCPADGRGTGKDKSEDLIIVPSAPDDVSIGPAPPIPIDRNWIVALVKENGITVSVSGGAGLGGSLGITVTNNGIDLSVIGGAGFGAGVTISTPIASGNYPGINGTDGYFAAVSAGGGLGLGGQGTLGLTIDPSLVEEPEFFGEAEGGIGAYGGVAAGGGWRGRVWTY